MDGLLNLREILLVILEVKSAFLFTYITLVLEEYTFWVLCTAHTKILNYDNYCKKHFLIVAHK